uniref:EF-hand domain-containing protein n=1 Tax=Chromera velia CCMP2878 TaxID=1169474 RepID=A0A0G4I4L9_9ALVE|eukprot:Cvel_1792.t1-p1 / transcript=Cvel_1792.t1 / gene=Cvel_1792 / organism=Chromera_velia_CCMP2878 / gene_product=Recoverin family protein DDB_G0274781, putative / transcript_product=Recoverin family protein DDB_G0274781, putative / location=Cvel_scaffold66:30717-36390(-) / protein_length=476 / sequence_SO=supercontig / SO=protein_coding / is_pseudo=false
MYSQPYRPPQAFQPSFPPGATTAPMNFRPPMGTFPPPRQYSLPPQPSIQFAQAPRPFPAPQYPPAQTMPMQPAPSMMNFRGSVPSIPPQYPKYPLQSSVLPPSQPPMTTAMPPQFAPMRPPLNLSLQTTAFNTRSLVLPPAPMQAPPQPMQFTRPNAGTMSVIPAPVMPPPRTTTLSHIPPPTATQSIIRPPPQMRTFQYTMPRTLPTVGTLPMTSVVSMGAPIATAVSGMPPPLPKGPTAAELTATVQNPEPLNVDEWGMTEVPMTDVHGGVEAYEKKHAGAKDNELRFVEKLRQKCGLAKIPVKVALQHFMESADKKTQSLDRPAFKDAYLKLLAKQSIDPPKDRVVEALFDLFDKDDSGTIDALEVVFGVSTLCEGDKEQKIQAVFDALDTDNNKVISKEELFKLVFAVFQVVVTEKKLRKLRGLGVEVYTAREFAEHTVAEAFKQADTNSDSVLSYEEFKKWFESGNMDLAV